MAVRPYISEFLICQYSNAAHRCVSLQFQASFFRIFGGFARPAMRCLTRQIGRVLLWLLTRMA
jgi:hypothetical protein